MFYKYKVTYYSEYDGDEHEAEGIVWAKDYGKAANKVVEDYGVDTINDVYVKEICMDGVLCLDKSEIGYLFPRD